MDPNWLRQLALERAMAWKRSTGRPPEGSLARLEWDALDELEKAEEAERATK